MRLIGCSGFPVPATKYLKEFTFVEVADTAIGVPGPALVRRWRREAPDGFVFTALCPKEVSLDAFKPTAAGETAWNLFLPVARELDVAAIVVTSPTDAGTSKLVRASARTMLERLVAAVTTRLVWEPPADWALKDAEAVAKDLAVIVARDPQRHPPVAKGEIAYFRMNGPAGYKSRYEDPTLEASAKTIRETRAEKTIVVLANVDMYADAKRMRSSLE